MFFIFIDIVQNFLFRGLWHSLCNKKNVLHLFFFGRLFLFWLSRFFLFFSLLISDTILPVWLIFNVYDNARGV